MINKEITEIFGEIIKLLELKGDKALNFKIKAYKKAIGILDALQVDVADIYKGNGLKAIMALGIGEKNAKKIEEYIKRQKIKDFEELKEETAIQNIIAHYFQTKGIGLQELKNNAKKKKIIYSRFTKPAKQLLELAGSTEKAKEAITTVSKWANTRKLDYAIETVFKKWLELDRLKPKEIVKKPFYKGDPMIWSETKKKWFVIKNGEWLEYVGKKEDVEWRITE
ncbi:MAG: helix-hairpin-helix domain-containing protein [Candidatus Staskawiczbacteria bacterium]|jgi:DNA polymerase/3'-5' exonuclease PolX